MADAHKITCLVFRQERGSERHHRILQFGRFAYAYTANRKTVKVHLYYLLDRLSAQIFKHSALDNAENRLACFSRAKRAGGPCGSALHCAFNFFARTWIDRTFIECHADIDT